MTIKERILIIQVNWLNKTFMNFLSSKVQWTR